MDDREAIDMMRRCSAEIKGLRAEIARLRPKADAYDNLSAMIGLLPRRSEAMSEDLAHKLDMEAAKIVDSAKSVAAT